MLSLILHPFTLFAVLLISFTIYYYKALTYWKSRKVVGLPTNFPLGNLTNPLGSDYNLGTLFQFLYHIIKCIGNGKFAGLYLITVPKLLVVDPVVMKYILQQDFNHFTERGFYYNEKDDPLSANLFALGGEKWRYIRTKLSPVFTSGKLRIMFENILQSADQLRGAVDKMYETRSELDSKDVAVSYSIDVIGSCAFGLECNSFKDPNSEFRREGERIFDFSSTWRTVKAVMAFSFPTTARFLKITLFDKQTIEFFVNLVKDAIKFRRANNVTRKDMIQLLMDLKEDKNDKNDPFEEENVIRELAAQVFIFFAAGFETSSTTLTYCLYELSKNPEIQQKLRNEIFCVLEQHPGGITYDSITEMTYMNQIIDETLRKYPPVTFVSRVCVKDYKIPDTDVVVEKGVEIFIPILGLHRDGEYYPEPRKFDPERFSEENKKKRTPFTYLPFGEGPRICIGLRFGLIQIKIALATLLQRYKFSLNHKTNDPLEYKPLAFTLIPRGKVLLDIEKIH